jgi:hypothetical protein
MPHPKISARIVLLALAVTAPIGAGLACDEQPIPTARTGTQLESLTVRPATVPADDVTLMTVSAILPRESSVPLRQVIFATTAGRFLASGSGVLTEPPSDSNDTVATALLRAPAHATTATLTAAAGDTTIAKTIVFTPAPPDSIQLEPSTFELALHTASSLTITAFLQRDTGFVSDPFFVHFSAPVGTFGGNTVSNDSGVVHVQYTPGLVTVPSPMAIVITATVTGPNSTTVSDSTVITVVDSLP